MTATNHVLTGVLIGTVVHAPWLAIPLALASHFVCDALPHFDIPSKKFDLTYYVWLAGDMAIAASILLALWLLHPGDVMLMLVCGIVAASPDLMWIYYLIYKKGKPGKLPVIPRFHMYIQKHTSSRYWPIELAWFLTVGGLVVSRLQ